VPSARLQKKSSEKPELSEEASSHRIIERMAEALDPHELDAALDDDVPKFPIDDRPKTIDDLPQELLVSVFEAVGDPIWVRHPVPLVCKAWAELYRSRDARIQLALCTRRSRSTLERRPMS
jgi:hypothetical protein